MKKEDIKKKVRLLTLNKVISLLLGEAKRYKLGKKIYVVIII